MLAVASLVGDGEGLLRTAFAVTQDRALTAFHCIGDRHTGFVERQQVDLHFGAAGVVQGEVLTGDGPLDFAVLALDPPLPPGVDAIPLAERAVPNEAYRALGHPAAAEGIASMAVSGLVTNPDARHRRRRPGHSAGVSGGGGAHAAQRA